MELKDRSKLSKDLEKEVQNIEEDLRKEEAINNRLESQVSSFMEKRKHEENIIWLKRKRSVLVNFSKKIKKNYLFFSIVFRFTKIQEVNLKRQN